MKYTAVKDEFHVLYSLDRTSLAVWENEPIKLKLKDFRNQSYII